MNEPIKRKPWKKSFKKELIVRSGGMCEKCKTRPAEHIHHLTYKRLNRELLTDVLHLCIVCHSNEHPEHRILKAKKRRYQKQVRKIEKEALLTRQPALTSKDINKTEVKNVVIETTYKALKALYEIREAHQKKNRIALCVVKDKVDSRCTWCRAFDLFVGSFEKDIMELKDGKWVLTTSMKKEDK